MDAQFVFLFMIIGFCAGCLLVAVVCYAILFRVISRIVKQDMQVKNIHILEYIHVTITLLILDIR